MASLKDRIHTGLDETRMLVLGAQVLIGFQYRSVFEPGFKAFSQSSQYLALSALGCLLVSVALLMSPGAHHQLVEQTRNTESLHRFTTVVTSLALFPFALGLAVIVFLVAERVAGHAWGLAAGIATAGVALFFWYGLELVRRLQFGPRPADPVDKDPKGSDDADLTELIAQVLVEVRVIIPGAQALLGFQLVIVLMDGFDSLPTSSKYAHLVSLLLMAVSVVFLMTPAAYHRIVEAGHESWKFYWFAHRMLLAAMVPLPLGIAGDFFVVMRKITGSVLASVLGGILVLGVFYGFWFGLIVLRSRSNGREFTTPLAD